MFHKPTLERYRRALTDPKRGGALAKVAKKSTQEGYELGGSRVQARADGVRRRGRARGPTPPLRPVAGITVKPPRETHTSASPEFCFAHHRAMAPLQEWLVANVA